VKKPASPWVLLVVAAAGTLALAYVYWSGFIFVPHASADKLGQLGDFFGGLLNPLVSTLTLFVAISVWRLQKDELELTRSEMAQNKLAMEDQAKTAVQQRREQRFFDLLNLCQETLKTFAVEGASGRAALNNWQKLSPKTGKCEKFLECGFDQFHDSLVGAPVTYSEQLRRAMNPQFKSLTLDEVAHAWNSFSPLLDHYFRTISAAIGQLERLLVDDHWRYAKLFGSEGEKMRPLVSKYGLLKNLASTKLRDHAVLVLEPHVFGRGWTEAPKIAPLPKAPHAA
jgi:hypothetical protein